jgi:hypothetical protein
MIDFQPPPHIGEAVQNHQSHTIASGFDRTSGTTTAFGRREMLGYT